MPAAEIGIFGGSGFTSFLDDVETVELDTPYGAPSAPITIGAVAPAAVRRDSPHRTLTGGRLLDRAGRSTRMTIPGLTRNRLAQAPSAYFERVIIRIDGESPLVGE